MKSKFVVESLNESTFNKIINYIESGKAEKIGIYSDDIEIKNFGNVLILHCLSQSAYSADDLLKKIQKTFNSLKGYLYEPPDDEQGKILIITE